MAKKANLKMLLAMILLSILIVSSACASLIPGVKAADLTAQKSDKSQPDLPAGYIDMVTKKLNSYNDLFRSALKEQEDSLLLDSSNYVSSFWDPPVEENGGVVTNETEWIGETDESYMNLHADGDEALAFIVGGI